METRKRPVYAILREIVGGRVGRKAVRRLNTVIEGNNVIFEYDGRRLAVDVKDFSSHPDLFVRFYHSNPKLLRTL